MTFFRIWRDFKFIPRLPDGNSFATNSLQSFSLAMTFRLFFRFHQLTFWCGELWWLGLRVGLDDFRYRYVASRIFVRVDWLQCFWLLLKKLFRRASMKWFLTWEEQRRHATWRNISLITRIPGGQPRDMLGVFVQTLGFQWCSLHNLYDEQSLSKATRVLAKPIFLQDILFHLVNN